MSIAATFIPHPRVVVLCLASLLLHTLTIRWVGGQIDQRKPPAAKPAPATIVAQLRTIAPPRDALTSVQPKPAPKPAAPVRKPVPKVEEPETAAPSEPAAPGEATASAGEVAAQPEAPRGQAPATAAVPPDAVPAAPATPEPVENTPAQPAPPAGPRRFKVSLPPSAELVMEVRRKDADGALWNGAGAIIWQNAGATYKVAVEAGLNMIVTRLNLLVLTSEGSIGADGIAPQLSTEKRRGRSQTATHFNQQEGRITFSSSERSYPLPPGTQDKATLPLQLAGIGRADPGQLSGDIEIMVGEDRDANMFRFIVIGQEEVETKMGKLTTWHLSRPPRPGTYNSKLEVWLAPERDWYPVQIRNTEANGAVTTQIVTKIVPQ
jgi:hypothetical protein